jgi:hypothetical protein
MDEAVIPRRSNKGWFRRGDKRINLRGRPVGARLAARLARDGEPLFGRLMTLFVPMEDQQRYLTQANDRWIDNLPRGKSHCLGLSLLVGPAPSALRLDQLGHAVKQVDREEEGSFTVSAASGGLAGLWAGQRETSSSELPVIFRAMSASTFTLKVGGLVPLRRPLGFLWGRLCQSWSRSFRQSLHAGCLPSAGMGSPWTR